MCVGVMCSPGRLELHATSQDLFLRKWRESESLRAAMLKGMQPYLESAEKVSLHSETGIDSRYSHEQFDAVLMTLTRVGLSLSMLAHTCCSQVGRG